MDRPLEKGKKEVEKKRFARRPNISQYDQFALSVCCVIRFEVCASKFRI